MCGAVGGGVGNDFFNGPFTDVGTWEIKVGKKIECEDTSILESICWYVRVCTGKYNLQYIYVYMINYVSCGVRGEKCSSGMCLSASKQQKLTESSA